MANSGVAHTPHISLGWETPAKTAGPEPLLLFFITGNPGLIEYYRAFLTLCYDGLRQPYKSQEQSDIPIHIFGTSMAGFEDAPDSPSSGPFDLEQQIVHLETALRGAYERTRARYPASKGVHVVLAGHSVGSYILLELLRRHQARAKNQIDGRLQMRIIGGICLFPTVVDIAKSDSGRHICYLFTIPHLPRIAGWLVKMLTFWLSVAILQRLVSLMNGMPSDAAHTTASFIKSKGGVEQALYLAKHEMATITTDKWDDELWGIVDSNTKSHQSTKLYFYFGKDDHWVADETRDELIAARVSKRTTGQKDSPIMKIDETGIPHSFCIKHNEPVAHEVVDYVRDIIQTQC